MPSIRLFPIKYIVLIVAFLVTTTALCALVYSSEVRHAATYTAAPNGDFFGSRNTGIREWFDFTKLISQNFAPNSPGVGAILCVVFLEGVLIIRLRRARGTGVLWRNIAISVLYQVVVIVMFFAPLFAGMYAASQALMSDAAGYLASHPEFVSIMNGKVMTDENAILAAIKSDTSRLVVTEDPRLLGSPQGSGLTFFLAYAVPRYLREQGVAKVDKFLDYAALPYYFIYPNYLVVKDKKSFMKDLGPIVSRNIIDSLLKPYTQGISSPEFKVLPLGEYAAEYRNGQIHDLQNSISSLQTEIQANKDAIAKNDQIIAEDKALLYYRLYPDKLTSLEDQAESIKQQALAVNADDEKYIQQYTRTLNDYSDPTSVAYRKSENTIGAFKPPSELILREPETINGPVTIGQSGPSNLGEILRVMIHESLHYYASVNSGNVTNGLNGFLFEGFTDYFALKAMGYADDQMPYAAGYPVHVQVIALLAEKIPLSELEKINFTDSQNLFKADFKKYFPNSDYQAFTKLNNETSAWWFDTGFGLYGVAYVNDSYVQRAKAILYPSSH